MNLLLKIARENKGYSVREIASLLNIDKALISKFENGSRRPTKEQILKLANLLDIDYTTILIEWHKEKILNQIENEPLALNILLAVEKSIKNKTATYNYKISKELENYLLEIDKLKQKLNQFDNSRLDDIFKKNNLAFTYESNRMDGNTLTLNEIDLVVNKGMTISGKSMKEHLEVINYHEAILFVKANLSNKFIINSAFILSIQNLIMRGIQSKNANNLEQEKGIDNQNDEVFNWFEKNKNIHHPIILATKILLFLVSINECKQLKISTLILILNSVLFINDYAIAIIKSNPENINKFNEALKNSLLNENDESLQIFIAKVEIECLNHYLNLLSK